MRIVRRVHEIHGSALTAQSGNSTIIVNLQTQAADYATDGRRMTVACAWNGRQEVANEGRRVLVDDDTWMVVPASPVTLKIRATRNVHALTILFRPGMPEEVLSSLITPDDRLLEDGEIPTSSCLPFMPHLQIHDRSVTPVLLFIRRHCEMGLEDPLWYEEQLAFLLERMLMRHRHIVTRTHAIPVRRAATRREIVRRISLATDFIHSNYSRPLMLNDMAGAAFLSRHHFLRLFKHMQDATPHEYLQRKRAAVAARLLHTTELQVEDIVKEVGFDSRSTLFRALRRFHAMTPRECRHATEVPMFMGREFMGRESAKAAVHGPQATGSERVRGHLAAELG